MRLFKELYEAPEPDEHHRAHLLLPIGLCPAINAQTDSQTQMHDEYEHIKDMKNAKQDQEMNSGPAMSSDGVMFLVGMAALVLANRSSRGGTSSYPQYHRLPPLKIAVEQHAVVRSVAILPEERTIYCATGTILSLGGSLPGGSYLPPALEVDRRRVASDHAALMQGDYLFYWTASDPGDHVLRVLFTARDGDAPATLRTVHVCVSDTAPVSFTSVPPTADADTQVPIARSTLAGFKPARSEVILDAGDFDLTDDRATLAVPASKMLPGTYAFSIASYAADGTRFVSMPRMMRIQHAAPAMASAATALSHLGK